MDKAADTPLGIALEAAVPLKIAELRRRGGPDATDRAQARAFADVLACQGDQLLYGGNKPGDAARLFNGLVHALAVLSCVPGGVRFAGAQWEALPCAP